MARMRQGFKEAKTVVCYGEDAAGHPMRRCAVRFEPAAPFKPHVWATAGQHGLEQAQEKVLSGERAAWIRDHPGPLLQGATCLVDWFHAMQHAWDCGPKLHGQGTEATTRWAQGMEALLWNGNVREMLRRLSLRCVRLNGHWKDSWERKPLPA